MSFYPTDWPVAISEALKDGRAVSSVHFKTIENLFISDLSNVEKHDNTNWAAAITKKD